MFLFTALKPFRFLDLVVSASLYPINPISSRAGRCGFLTAP